jgi:hypothetical protein
MAAFTLDDWRKSMSENLPATINQIGMPISAKAEILIHRPPIGGVWTTLALDSDEAKIKAANMAMGQGVSVEELAGKEILVQDLLLKGIQITDPQSGEVVDAILTLLIPPTGAPVQCASWGVIGSLETVATLIGRPPWKPALKVKVESFRTRGKNLAYRLHIIGRATE